MRSKSFQTRVPRNEAEQSAHRWLRKAGYLLCRRGYPDFITMDEDGEIAFVEVKPTGRTQLRPAQAALMAALTEAGFRCYRYSPDEGFRLLVLEELEPSRQAMMEEARGCSAFARRLGQKEKLPRLEAVVLAGLSLVERARSVRAG